MRGEGAGATGGAAAVGGRRAAAVGAAAPAHGGHGEQHLRAPSRGRLGLVLRVGVGIEGGGALGGVGAGGGGARRDAGGGRRLAGAGEREREDVWHPRRSRRFSCAQRGVLLAVLHRRS